MNELETFTFEKTETEVIRLKVRLARLLEYVWQPGEDYATNDYIRPESPNGFSYRATTTGQSASRIPRFPKTLGATVIDGSVTWEASAIDGSSADGVSSVNIIADTGITTGTPTTTGSLVTFSVSGGEKGRNYEISFEVTTSANEVFEIKIMIFVVAE